MADEKNVRKLIKAWDTHRGGTPAERRYCQLAGDLYQVRNPGFNGAPPLSHWPAELLAGDDEEIAAVEHYFLTRCWVGTGQFPAWQVRTMRDIYDVGKRMGLTPRHNPDNPTTPPSELQRQFQNEGIRDGERDRQAAGVSAPLLGAPPVYY